MNENSFMSFIVGALLGGLIISILVGEGIHGKYKSDLLERGHAIYCPDDGVFSYVGECDE